MDNLATLPEIDKILPDEKRELQKVEIDKDAQPIVEESTADQAVADQAAVDTAVTEENTQKSVEESVYKDTVTPSRVEWNISKIKAPQVWAKGIDGKGVPAQFGIHDIACCVQTPPFAMKGWMCIIYTCIQIGDDNGWRCSWCEVDCGSDF